jgi:hypothetical protein
MPTVNCDWIPDDSNPGGVKCRFCGFQFKKPVKRRCRVGKTYKKNLMAKVERFSEARDKWKDAGKPVRTDEEIFRIYHEVCKECEYFDNDKCGICGCRLKPKGHMLNKIAWATEKCPLDPPKWIAEIELEEPEESKEPEPAESNQTSLPQNRVRKRPPRKERRGCGCGKKNKKR